MWFTELAAEENPGPKELELFVDATVRFLDFALNTNELSFLWEGDEDLAALARETFKEDVRPSARDLRAAISEIPQDALIVHGLIGRPMRFKFRVMDTIGRQWDGVRGHFSVREWFKRIVEAIDAVLGSLIAALSGPVVGTGSLLKEFKDALSSLASTTP